MILATVRPMRVTSPANPLSGHRKDRGFSKIGVTNDEQ
jgi:hypothetical protein